MGGGEVDAPIYRMSFHAAPSGSVVEALVELARIAPLRGWEALFLIHYGSGMLPVQREPLQYPKGARPAPRAAPRPTPSPPPQPGPLCCAHW